MKYLKSISTKSDYLQLPIYVELNYQIPENQYHTKINSSIEN